MVATRGGLPYGKSPAGSELTDWQEERNATQRKVRARVEHDALAEMKNWKILRDYRRAAHTLAATGSGIASSQPHDHRLMRHHPRTQHRDQLRDGP